MEKQNDAKIYRKRETTYNKGQNVSVQNNLDEIITFQNTINSIHKFQSLLTGEEQNEYPYTRSHVYHVFIQALWFSPVYNTQPVFHIQLHLHVELARRTSGQSLETFQKQRLFRNRTALDK